MSSKATMILSLFFIALMVEIQCAETRNEQPLSPEMQRFRKKQQQISKRQFPYSTTPTASSPPNPIYYNLTSSHTQKLTMSPQQELLSKCLLDSRLTITIPAKMSRSTLIKALSSYTVAVLTNDPANTKALTFFNLLSYGKITKRIDAHDHATALDVFSDESLVFINKNELTIHPRRGIPNVYPLDQNLSALSCAPNNRYISLIDNFGKLSIFVNGPIGYISTFNYEHPITHIQCLSDNMIFYATPHALFLGEMEYSPEMPSQVVINSYPLTTIENNQKITHLSVNDIYCLYITNGKFMTLLNLNTREKQIFFNEELTSEITALCMYITPERALCFILGNADGMLSFWTIFNNKCNLYATIEHEYPIESIEKTPDNKMIIVKVSGNKIYAYATLNNVVAYCKTHEDKRKTLSLLGEQHKNNRRLLNKIYTKNRSFFSNTAVPELEKLYLK